MRTIRSLLWIGTGRGLCESGMTEAPELDVTWVRNLKEAALLPRVQFDGVLYEAQETCEVEDALVMASVWGHASRLLVCLPKRYEPQAEELLENGVAALFFVDSIQSGPGFVSEIAQALDILHEDEAPRCPMSPPRRTSCAAPSPPPAPTSPASPPSEPTTPRNQSVESRTCGSPPIAERAAGATILPFIAPSDTWRPDDDPAPQAEAIETEETTPRVVSSSRAMNEVAELVDLAASSPSTVLLTGETGVGKEVIALQLHARSCREEEPFIAINCAAFPESLLESELFGHVKGAFTGADRAKAGLFEAAGRGTLFLDEIAEMELPLQAKLLRVLQEREIRPVGGTAAIPVHCRMVAATNRILAEEVSAGHFREDLFYRLNVFPIRIPPLRERRRDVLPLARYFLALHGPREGKRGCHLSLASAQLLEAYSWPGNVRELENEILRVLMLTPSHQLITPKALSGKIVEVLEPIAQGSRPDESLREALERVESWLIRRALANNGGQKARTARKLGLTREGLYKKMKRLGIG